jgi:glycerophosphoryl diester phosphodiesterase
MPELINTIKESGLMLATFGLSNDDATNIRQQETNGVDATFTRNVLHVRAAS